MKFTSTRSQAPQVGIDEALVAGLAPDGGLYVPVAIPKVRIDEPGATLADTATALLAPYFVGSRLEAQLPDMCRTAFDFPVPLRSLQGVGDYLLELFHGPTAAFKDIGARFLAEALSRLREPGAPPITILVATSGDTGAAVGAAFHRREGFRVVILYPDGRVSPRQAHGLGCFGDNVQALRVEGTFDDCQQLVKQALTDASLRETITLGSANSISLGRLLPQMAYYAHTSLQFHEAHRTPLNFVIPTGNLGNALAAWLARSMGLPIGDIVIASNANDVLPRYFAGEDYRPQAGMATLANAMDVGAPSNFERLRWWHDDDAAVRASLQACSVDDDQIRQTIIAAPARHGTVPCPHTAVALHELQGLRAQGDDRPWAVVSTAHPAKFETVVEPLVGHEVSPPPALAAALAGSATAMPLGLEYAAFRDWLLESTATA